MRRDDPSVKMAMRLRLDQLLVKARELGVDEGGTKIEVAVRVAEAQEAEFERKWAKIAGRGD